MKFDTGYGEKYFRVVHDHQKQICNMCGSPSHKYRQCPNLICPGCDEQGHKMKECKAKKCDKCDSLRNHCFCPNDDDGTCPYCGYKPCECVCEICHEKYDDCKYYCAGCGKLKEECECPNEKEQDDDCADGHDVENYSKMEVQVEVHTISKEMGDVDEGNTSTKGDDRNGGSDVDGDSSTEDTTEEIITKNEDRADDRNHISVKNEERDDVKDYSGAKNKDRADDKDRSGIKKQERAGGKYRSGAKNKERVDEKDRIGAKNKGQKRQIDDDSETETVQI
ncbi:unnamed protein product [Mytilus coruscus]|uniref:CCHC-type domain-containing protein n=1 Tax=Mytilus coruscus TaxID=42192 RepID=A0A6J8EUQ3_MYTCO|nr:unnamed protein product [Mytilus coruscus]